MTRPAPAFWLSGGGPARLLQPAGKLYDLAGRLRWRLSRSEKAECPVICVGNLVLGGSGKTPVVRALVARLKDRGRKVHVLSRGYGGRAHGPLRVNPESQDATEVGDEPLLLARDAVTWVSRDRVAGAQAALEAGADCLVMDDGLQNPGLAKDLSFLVIDGPSGFGNGHVFPAGPLRESPRACFARVQAAILVGPPHPGLLDELPAALPRIFAGIEPLPGADKGIRGRRFLAFAGIARPEKFFQSLRDLGANLAATQSFGDHHYFSRDELTALRAQAAKLDATLITTEKDLVRLPAHDREAIDCLPVQLVWEETDLLNRLLDKVLSS
jgi:tetraacyldisaccharide 4'-kinase